MLDILETLDQSLTNTKKETSKGTIRKQRIAAIIKEFTGRKSSNTNGNSGCKNYQVICDNSLEKSAAYAEVQTHYQLILDRFLEAIKNGTSEGKPEILKDKTPDGLRKYSRRISLEHRLVYAYDHIKKRIIILEYGSHYGQ